MGCLIDTDMFCKLGIMGLLGASLEAVGCTAEGSFHLPSLPYMLRAGTLRRHYGDANCEKLIEMTKGFAPLPNVENVWIDEFAHVNRLDPGEAQLFAHAMDSDCPLLTGDKRAIEAISTLTATHGLLENRVICLESVLLRLCDTVGVDLVKTAMSNCEGFDKTMKICHSDSDTEVLQCLKSYFTDMQRSASPLLLWDPFQLREK